MILAQRLPWLVLAGSSLIVLSALLYFLHYLIFRDPHHIAIYLLGDLAFLPLAVLMVTLILHRLLAVSFFTGGADEPLRPGGDAGD
ncbi:MAG: hypothetical protein AB1330_00935 [Bacillota bacterium]